MLSPADIPPTHTLHILIYRALPFHRGHKMRWKSNRSSSPSPFAILHHPSSRSPHFPVNANVWATWNTRFSNCSKCFFQQSHIFCPSFIFSARLISVNIFCYRFMKVKIDFQLFSRTHLRIQKNVNLRVHVASTNAPVSNLISRQFASTLVYDFWSGE